MPQPGRSSWAKGFDWPLAATVLALTAIGLAAIHSATHGTAGAGEWGRQAVYLLPAALGAAALMRWGYAWLLPLAPFLYLLNLGLLGAVLLGGHSALGAQRWLNLGVVTIQPSEFAKLALIVTLARLLSASGAKDLWALGRVLLHVAPPFALVFRQPDLGTSLVFGAISLGMLAWAGLPGATMLALASPGVAVALHALGTGPFLAYLGAVALWAWKRWAAPWWAKLMLVGLNAAAAFAVPVAWGLLKPYQRKRLTVFLNPEADPLGSGYHIIQSKVAIGSGGLWGKGYLGGTQTQLHFIPEQHTDFVFSVIGEETGFVGALVLLGLFLMLVWRGILIAAAAKDSFGGLLAIGVVSMLLFHVVVNVGMTTGIMPVTGIPLPFVSAGGSALVSAYAAVGLLMAVALRRKVGPGPS